MLAKPTQANKIFVCLVALFYYTTDLYLIYRYSDSRTAYLSVRSVSV